MMAELAAGVLGEMHHLENGSHWARPDNWAKPLLVRCDLSREPDERTLTGEIVVRELGGARPQHLRFGPNSSRSPWF